LPERFRILLTGVKRRDEIAPKPATRLKSDLVPRALAALPAAAIIAFHTEEGLLHVIDDYADATLSYLSGIGIQAES
jgi:hypothetical protein